MSSVKQERCEKWNNTFLKCLRFVKCTALSVAMESLAILGLVSNVCQFVEQGWKIILLSKEIYESSDGSTRAVANLRLLLEDLRTTTDEVKLLPASSLSPDEKALQFYLEECQNIASQLTVLIGKLTAQAGTKSRTLESMRVAFQSVAKKGEIEKMKSQLLDLDRRVRIRLRKILDKSSTDGQERRYSSVVARLDRLDENYVRMDAVLSARFENLRRSLSDQIIARSLSAAGLASLLDQFREEMRQADLHQTILGSLRFHEIRQRLSDIDPAFRKTLGWMFEPERTSYLDWLRSDQPLYWISGLAGSGKSTIMKYIWEHSKTVAALREQNGGTYVTTASFFFWNQGTKMQKSQRGLLQSLLFQILRLDASLTAKLCIGRDGRDDWTVQELLDTFDKLRGCIHVRQVLFLHRRAG